MRQFSIRPMRSPDGSLVVTVAFDASVDQLSPVEQAKVYERAYGVALEATRTAVDPALRQHREELSRRALVARAG